MNDNKKNPKISNNWTVPKKTVDALKALAKQEHRNDSNMVTVLIQEALASRGVEYK